MTLVIIFETINIRRQDVYLIPPNIFHAVAATTKDLPRVFTPWIHAVALIYQQFTKTESLNGVCVDNRPRFAGERCLGRAGILAEGAGTVVALEAALALRLDPGCVPALADPSTVRTARTPRRLLGWLLRRRSA